MSRVPTAGNTIVVKPGNDVYTVLVVAGFIAVAVALAVLFIRADAMQIKIF